MKEVLVRLDRCMGCRSCQLACAVEHSATKTLFGAISEKDKPRYRIYVERADDVNIPLTCRHCDPAPCVDACISGSLTRDERGAVIQKPDRCVGCWTCMMVCPYGVVGRQVEQRVATKCDRCPDRDVPACVSACPTKALVYAEVEEFGGTVRKIAAGIVAKAKAAGG
jgi:carbon-monoxide dehydrogenase iron sulfur subunit